MNDFAETGVGGSRDSAIHAARDDVSGDRALRDLNRWRDGRGVFPYDAVVTHYQAVGRTHADARLVRALRDAHAWLSGPADPGDAPWSLATWLPSTFDQDDGDYDSYLGTELLEGVAGVRIDTLIVTLIAELLATEAAALSRAPEHRAQRARTQACLHALTKSALLAPDAPDATEGEPGQDGGAEFAAYCRERAGGALAAVPTAHLRAVNLAMLPTTRLHDEHMFIRSIQIFEMLYRQVVGHLTRATRALELDDAGLAKAELAEAAGRLEATAALYRVVTTMPKKSFAVIREYTSGRSAIQSKAYREVELLSATRTPHPYAEKLPEIGLAGPTLQDAFVAAADRLPSDRLTDVAVQLARLDGAWRGMKRTHWGITLKIIGVVPGTGGTAGADYLKTTAEMPLFPALTTLGTG
ncbi:hypothetical protein [Spirillospora sp. NPDC047279]|uniref:hypothetical protein n=1 Tax=Spirillospora sp. NPDC047279 TaxID=3155478 RepID=UPI0033DBC8BD